MSRSPVISTIPIFALLIVSTVLSAPREEITAQAPMVGELRETRESEVSRKEKSLHRLASVVIEPLPEANGSQAEKGRTVSPSTIKHETLQSNDSESKDMLETHVTPQDDDDATSKRPSEKTQKSSNLNTKNSEHLNGTGMLSPFIFPDNNSSADIRTFTPEWFEQFNQTKYSTNETVTVTANKTAKPMPVLVVTISPNSSPPTEATPPAVTSATAPTEVINTATVTTITTEIATLLPAINNENREELTTTTYQPTSSTLSPAEMKLHEKRGPVPEPMPTGVAALIAAISFAIVVVVTYIGLLLRRRYLEWRYGNRELLVNDFDAADMSNFEL